MFAKDFRALARQSLNHKWGEAMVTTLIAGFLIGTAYIPFTTNFNVKDQSNQLFSYIDSGAIYAFFAFASGLVAITSLIAIVKFIIGGPVNLGFRTFTTNLVDGKPAKIKDLFSRFDQFGEGFLMQLLLTIYTTLWSLLFIVPGIVKSFSYAMTPYILLDNPNLSANEAITASRQLMRGNKWRLFCLRFSFLGWVLLCILSFGIGFLWLNPYMATAEAVFYRRICAEKSATVNQPVMENNI